MIFIHVIGLVGAGKTTFIEKHLTKYPCFDIQTIYKRNHIIPEELKRPKAYHQYFAILRQSFEKFVHDCQEDKVLIGIIESSGANHGLNQMLQKNLSYSIWIIPDLTRLNDPEFIARRPYAPALNAYLLNLYTKNRLHRIDVEFNLQNLTFKPNLPAPLRPIFPDLLPHHSNFYSQARSNQTGRSGQSRFYECPECGAAFSKPAYLELHFSRMPQHHQHQQASHELRKKKKPLEMGALSQASKKFLS